MKVLDPTPLVAAIDRAVAVFAAEHGSALGLLGWSKATGIVSARQVHRWRQGAPVTLGTADRVAVELGHHPSEIWGDAWWSTGSHP